MMDYAKISKQIRVALMAFAESSADEVACQIPAFFKSWEEGATYNAGDRREYGEKLYKCIQPHTAQSGWEPDKTPALWVVVDVKHSGGREDPIPASRGMEFVYGKYYIDEEVNKVYLCSRVGEPDGGTITLHFMPHELVGQYFDEVM